MLASLKIYRSVISLILISLLAGTPALAEIYTWTDADGNTVFSDQPEEGASKMKLPPPQAYAPTEIRPTVPANLQPSENTAPTISYKLLSITQPLPDQALWANNGQIDIALAIEPTLASTLGHSISISLDGKNVIDKTSSSQLQLDEVDRGSHTLIAMIHDKLGKVLIRSKPVTFHVHRVSALNKK
jgi:hypothetical protein